MKAKKKILPRCWYCLPNYTTALPKMLVPSTNLHKDTFQNVGTIYQTTQLHFPKCQYHLPSYKRTLSKMSVSSNKLQQDTFQNVSTIYQTNVMSQNTGTIYQTTLLYTKINVPSNKLQSIPKYLYHLPYYSIMSRDNNIIKYRGTTYKTSVISQNIGTIYQTTVL